jgi:monoamine oxidase
MPNSVDRREFLKLGLLAASAQFVPQTAWSSSPKPLPAAAPAKKILIIGAGLAGLVAGYELTQAGHDITILEAQLHSGGRVQTVREPFSDGMYAEAGPARIPDTHNLTLHYVKQFGLPLVPFYPNKLARVFVIGDKRIPVQAGSELDLSQVPLDLTAEERRLGMSGLLEKYLAGALEAMGDPAAPDWPNTAAKAYDKITLAEFLKQQGASHGAIELLEYPFASAEDDPVSLLWNLRETWYESREKTRYKINGGNDQLPKAFAAILKDKIHYGSPVLRIEQDASKVRAVATQSGTRHTFEADRLICTVPFPVMWRMEIQPQFSDAKRKAIAELTYDTVTRVILQCRTRYWEKEGHNGFGISDLPQEIWHPTFDQPGTRGLLVSYMFFGVGRRAGAMSEDQRLEFVAREMERVHPGLRDNLEGSVSKVWTADPWAGGATSMPSPGQMSGIGIGMEKPEGRVHFAGEHVSRWQAWMQGALESGLRAAKEVSEAA